MKRPMDVAPGIVLIAIIAVWMVVSGYVTWQYALMWGVSAGISVAIATKLFERLVDRR